MPDCVGVPLNTPADDNVKPAGNELEVLNVTVGLPPVAVNVWLKALFTEPGLEKKEIEEPGFDDDTKRQIIEQLRGLNTETSIRLAEEMESSLRPG